MAATTFRVHPDAPARSVGGWVRAFRLVAVGADAVDRRRWSRRPLAAGEAPPAGAVAGAWAIVKLALTAVASPVMSVAIGARAAANTASIRRLALQYPDEVQRVIDGAPTSIPNGRVGRLDASSRIFVTSDLHRCIAGAADWPAAQNAKGLYETALEYYGALEWTLVENGDVEDFWLVGGSTYGVLYDAVRTFGALLPRRWRERVRVELFGEHLGRIIANNRGIYDRIDELFHRAGRYHRLVGNHDDCYLDERVVDHLRRHHDGVEMHDFVVLDGPDGAAAVLAHGHHTDSWNAPHRAGLGRIGTWLASAVVDAPFLSANPGTPDPTETFALLHGSHTDVLTVVNPMLGFNRELYTIDEVLLYRAFEAHFGDDGPYLLLGHTHLPVSGPREAAEDGGAFRRYLNSGSGVHWEMVTGLEWDGTAADGPPSVRLVAWHYADEDTPGSALIGEHDGRPVARRWFEPSEDGRTLVVHPA